ncbi:hypothetical protein [Nonomuraea diastatica]|uniref:hypothetical protein n=1 Tax=Nonomuraea diastatica TaxID=1848329 RepID=UPI00140925A2|nr:hypothetical protein [Nonomuraea diastatica]
MTERRAMLSGSTFQEQVGYARAVVEQAATMVVCGLADPRMKVETEADARRGGAT